MHSNAEWIHPIVIPSKVEGSQMEKTHLKNGSSDLLSEEPIFFDSVAYRDAAIADSSSRSCLTPISPP